MNNLKRILFLFAITAASFSFSQTADEKPAGDATINASFCVELDDAIPVQGFYKADASALGWTSEADAKKACGFHSNNLVSYKQDFANNQILIYIHTDRTSAPHDIVWWNEYLESLCK